MGMSCNPVMPRTPRAGTRPRCFLLALIRTRRRGGLCAFFGSSKGAKAQRRTSEDWFAQRRREGRETLRCCFAPQALLMDWSAACRATGIESGFAASSTSLRLSFCSAFSARTPLFLMPQRPYQTKGKPGESCDSPGQSVQPGLADLLDGHFNPAGSGQIGGRVRCAGRRNQHSTCFRDARCHQFGLNVLGTIL